MTDSIRSDERPTPTHRDGIFGAAWFAAVAGMILAAAYTAGVSAPLAEPDEARYGEIAREMLLSGDWVTPRLNYVKYFEKPPLVYWASSLAFKAIGVTETAARLPVVLSALFCIAATWLLARRMYDRSTATLSALFLGTLPFFFGLGHILTLDVPLTFFVTLALTGFWVGNAGADGRAWYRLAYVATAFGILTKGPVAAVLVGAVAVVFLLLQRDWRGCWNAVDRAGIQWALLIVFPWFLLVSWRNPEFLDFFVVDQHIRRYLSSSQHHAASWALAAMFPVLLSPWAWMPLFDPAGLRSHLPPARWSGPTQFLLIWTLFVVAFFSGSSSKLITYVLPALPPAAILLARHCVRHLRRARSVPLLRVAWGLVVLGAVAVPAAVILPWVVADPRVAMVRANLAAGGIAIGAAGYASVRLLRGGRADVALLLLLLGMVSFDVIAIRARHAASEYRDLGIAAARLMRGNDRIATYRHYTQGIVFYSGRRVILVGPSQGELTFGSRQEDPSGRDAHFWEDERLFQEWRSPRRLFLVINRTELAQIAHRLDPPPIQVAAQRKKVLVVNGGAHD